MSYHNTSSPPMRSTTNSQGQVAPDGYHYMPDGTLMSDLDMETPMSSEAEDEPSPTNQY